MRSKNGFTLIELIFTMGLSLIVLSAGYRAYFSVTRADDVERHRERITITANSAMDHIREDIRMAGSARVSGDSLILGTSRGEIVYRGMRSGIERRVGSTRSTFKGVTASFKQSGPGVGVSIRARENIHRRTIRVDLDCFVTPRNG